MPDAMPTLQNSQIHRLPRTHQVWGWVPRVCAYNLWIICKCRKTWCSCLFPDTGPQKMVSLGGGRKGGRRGRERREGPKALASFKHQLSQLGLECSGWNVGCLPTDLVFQPKLPSKEAQMQTIASRMEKAMRSYCTAQGTTASLLG